MYCRRLYDDLPAPHTDFRTEAREKSKKKAEGKKRKAEGEEPFCVHLDLRLFGAQGKVERSCIGRSAVLRKGRLTPVLFLPAICFRDGRCWGGGAGRGEHACRYSRHRWG